MLECVVITFWSKINVNHQNNGQMSGFYAMNNSFVLALHIFQINEFSNDTFFNFGNTYAIFIKSHTILNLYNPSKKPFISFSNLFYTSH